MNILVSGGYIDISVNKKKYEGYKTERGRKSFVLSELTKILKSQKGIKVGEITVRELSITSNNFWGGDMFEISDIGNCASNPLPWNENYTSLRFFEIDCISVFENELPLKEQFFEIKDTNFYIKMCSAKII